MRFAILGITVFALTGCATVQPQQAVNSLNSSSGTKYSTQECAQARQAALSYDDNTAGRMGLGLGLGLLLGPFGLPFAFAADMSQSAKREAILTELRKHCEGDVAVASSSVISTSNPIPQGGDISSKMEMLKDLKAKGLLSEAEYTSKRLQLVDLAVSGASAAAPKAAVGRVEPVVGLRLVLSEFDPVSGISSGESNLTISSISPQNIEFNDGQLLIRRQDQTISKGWPGIAGIYGFTLAGLTPGSRVDAKFATSNVGSEIVPVTLSVSGIEQINRSGSVVQVARADVTGYSSTTVVYGTPGSHRGAPMKGTVFIDLATGLVVAGEVKSQNSLYAFRRELQRVVRPQTPS